jgi:hypothetical protein
MSDRSPFQSNPVLGTARLARLAPPNDGAWEASFQGMGRQAEASSAYTSSSATTEPFTRS